MRTPHLRYTCLAGACLGVVYASWSCANTGQTQPGGAGTGGESSSGSPGNAGGGSPGYDSGTVGSFGGGRPGGGDAGHPGRCDDAGNCTCVTIASIGHEGVWGPCSTDSTTALQTWLNTQS